MAGCMERLLTVRKDFYVVDGYVLFQLAVVFIGDEELTVVTVFTRTQHLHLHFRIVQFSGHRLFTWFNSTFIVFFS